MVIRAAKISGISYIMLYMLVLNFYSITEAEHNHSYFVQPTTTSWGAF